MSELTDKLVKRFGQNHVHQFSIGEEDYIHLLEIGVNTKQFPMRIIMTEGLSEYKMPVPERYKEWEATELYFCLPNYWDLNDMDNPRMNWPIKTIQRLVKNVIENKTWYGPGHTIANGNPPKAISETMKQEYFLLSKPIALEDYLQPLLVNEKEVHFLAVIPIFSQEFERKTSQGYYKWIKKYRLKNGNEILDDFRRSIHKKRRFF